MVVKVLKARGDTKIKAKKQKHQFEKGRVMKSTGKEERVRMEEVKIQSYL